MTVFVEKLIAGNQKTMTNSIHSNSCLTRNSLPLLFIFQSKINTLEPELVVQTTEGLPPFPQFCAPQPYEQPQRVCKGEDEMSNNRGLKYSPKAKPAAGQPVEMLPAEELREDLCYRPSQHICWCFIAQTAMVLQAS